MENEFPKKEQPNEQHLLNDMFGIGIDGEIRNKLYTIITWSRITAITGFVNVALSLLVTFVTYNSYSSALGFSRDSSVTIITTVISLAISFFLNYFLLQFSMHLRTSLDNEDQEAFTLATQQLRAYMRMLGIFLIVTILVTVLTSGFIAMMGARF